MADYIEREALLEAIDKAFDESPVEDTTAWMLGRRIIRKFSAADVAEIRHGNWKARDYDGFFPTSVVCSQCGEDYVLDEWGIEEFDEYMKYCPNCGARMDEEVSE